MRAMADPLLEARAALLRTLGFEAPPARFDEALTHASYANERKGVRDNERLEFLGDGVLDLCVSEALLERLDGADEGTLSRVYHALVSAEALAAWAREAGVGAALRMGRGASAAGDRDRTNVLADAVEAIVAAAYLDGGLDVARRVSAIVTQRALERVLAEPKIDAKSALQEAVQARGLPAPVYRTVAEHGPTNLREFVVAVEVSGQVEGEGRGRSKKQAEQAAAGAALLARRDAAGEDPR